MTDPKKIAVLVTTDAERRGVFAGWIDQDAAEIVKTGIATLTDARNCIYWHRSVGGVFGLAATGPNSECRIGAKVSSLALNGITSVSELSEAALKSWSEAETYGK
ncbi:MAG: hypothetical protein RLZZ511_4170 [Cyanobacteriota bacterium]